MYEKLKFQENKYILLNHLQVRRVFVHGCGVFSFRNTAVFISSNYLLTIQKVGAGELHKLKSN